MCVKIIIKLINVKQEIQNKADRNAKGNAGDRPGRST